MNLSGLYDKIPYDKLYPIDAKMRFAVLTLLPVGLVLVLFYFTVVINQEAEIEVQKNTLQKLNREINENRAHAEKRDHLRAAVKKLEVELDKAKLQLPDDQNIDELLADLSNKGREFGLEFKKFNPMNERMKQSYAEVPVKIEVTGQYHSVLKFFDEVANMDRIVTIQNITMKQSKDKAQGNIEMGCEAVAYRYIEATKPPMPVAKGAAKK